MVVIDYVPASHGHFLEYVVNKYIFNVPVSFDIFTQAGSSHNTQSNKEYKALLQVTSNHYTYHNIDFPEETQKVIQICHDPALDFVLLVNSFYRCHSPLPATASSQEIHKIHMENMGTNDNIALRANWYSKLQSRSGMFETITDYPVSYPCYRLYLNNFYNLRWFYTHLSSIADFVGQSFKPDTGLYELFMEFLQKNQGWQKYLMCQDILDAVVSNTKLTIPNDWQIHAYLNTEFGKLFKLYDGELFEDTYPKNTLQVHKIIQKHLQDFDSRF